MFQLHGEVFVKDIQVRVAVILIITINLLINKLINEQKTTTCTFTFFLNPTMVRKATRTVPFPAEEKLKKITKSRSSENKISVEFNLK